MVPESIVGENLVPLSELKKLDRNLYEKEVSKYKWRKNTLDVIIPKLNCLWNEAIHLTSINPQLIYKYFYEFNSYFKFKIKRDIFFYKIELSSLDKNQTCLYLPPAPPLSNEIYNEENPAPPWSISENEIVMSNNESDLAAYLQNSIPQQSMDYYNFEIHNNRFPLVFYGTTHILYKGNIHTKDLEIINWSE
jgi:hypothetical protein